MALPVLVGMAAKYVGSKVIEHGVEKLAESVMSSKEGSGPLDKAGKMDVPFGPSKMLMSAIAEPAVKSLVSGSALSMK